MITMLVITSLLFLIAIILLVAEKLLVTYGECSIIINKEKKLTVDGGDNLLTYLNQNKIYIPSACGGKATCGFCKVKVLDGSDNILPTEEIYINKQEKDQGIRLACQVKVKGELNIAIPEYLLNAEEFEAKVLDINNLTHDIKLIRLNILNSKIINFKPGQYVQLKIPGTDEFRAYSIASSPESNDLIELLIRFVPGGLCSTYVHKVLEKNDTVFLTGPFGDFYLHEEDTKDIIAIGGGCGMAPIRAMIYYLKAKGMPRKFVFFFGARSKRDLFFTDELRELEKVYTNFKYIPALSEPQNTDKWDGEIGLITHIVEKHLNSKGDKESYLCGPPPMIDAALTVLPKKGIKHENIYFDKF